MKAQPEIAYCPALRMKAGELQGVQALSPGIARHLIPHFIVPPQRERDSTQSQLFMLDNTPDISAALARHWRGRDALIDLTHLIDECGRSGISNWLPQMFQRARHAGNRPIPVALLSDLQEIETPAFAAAIDRSARLQFAISIPFSDINMSESRSAINLALARLHLKPDACAIIGDFCQADVSEPVLMAPVIVDSLEIFQEIGHWRHIIFQGAHFPDANPAAPGGSVLIPRNDWQAWLLAVGYDPTTAKQMMFGDYAADCAKIDFGGGGAKAIPHYRYATSDSCLVVRGAKTGTHGENMRSVATRIVDSGSFAGAGFSTADKFILQTARGGAPGNATTWRAVNTTHHLTRVIHDAAALLRIELAPMATEAEYEQAPLL